MVTVLVPATTANLGPGFDAFGAAVRIHLRATALPREGTGDRVRSAGEGADELPTDDGNLLWRSFLALCAHVGSPPPDVRVEVDNPIPLERGLGSSSAAIVAGLALARALLGAAVGDLELVRLATAIEGHPDNVAPAVLGGVVSCARGDDGALVVRRARPHPRLAPILLAPAQRQATAVARDVLPAALDVADVVDQAARAGHVLAGLLGAWPVAPQLAGDRLHEPPRLAAMGPTGELVRRLRREGVHAWLSGAGPAVAAAVAPSDARLVAACEQAAADLGFTVHAPGWDLAGATSWT